MLALVTAHAFSGALWGRGWRVFFLLAGAFGGVFVPVWLAVLAGRAAPPPWLSPLAWHAHEMVFGLVAAAVAGFLLTSVPVWTASAPLTGGRLALLAGLWVAGRAAVAAAGVLPAWLVAAADLAFLPALLLAVGRPIAASRNRRNYGFPLGLGALLIANALVHTQALAPRAASSDLGLRLGVYLVVLFITVIGGRIVPAFTANALRGEGREPRVRARPWLERSAAPAVALFALCDLAGAPPAASGGAAFAAAGLLALRMSGWDTLRTGGDPLLWSLHLGYAWLPAGLALAGLAALGAGVPRTTALHGLTAGAMGTMILAVMSRVALGHSGRPLAAPRAMTAAYLLVTAGALLRTAGPLLAPERTFVAVQIAGVLWAGAFLVFLAVYAPILTAPRSDGRPG